jgi:hypothetical protein
VSGLALAAAIALTAAGAALLAYAVRLDRRGAEGGDQRARAARRPAQPKETREEGSPCTTTT